MSLISDEAVLYFDASASQLITDYLLVVAVRFGSLKAGSESLELWSSSYDPEVLLV
jgi:hypothetical protein